MGKSKKDSSGEMPKRNCLACGNELDFDSKYCKYCGAPAEPETQKVPPHLRGKKSKKKLYVVLIIIILIIATIFALIIINFEEVDETVTYTYSPEDIPRSLKIDLDLESAGVEIIFTSEPTEPVVKLDYHKKWSGFVTRQPSFKTSSSKVTFKGSQVMGDADSKLTVILRSDVEYDIDSKIINGSIALNSDNHGVILGTINFDTSGGSTSIFCTNLTINEQIKLKSEDGSASVNLKDCTIGDIDCTFSSGSGAISLESCTIDDLHVSGDSDSFALNSKDSKIDSHSSWTFDVDSGNIVLDIEQSTTLGADVTIDSFVTGGKDIEVNYYGNATYIRAKFDGNKQIDIKENAGFQVLDSKTLESSNFSNETLDKFDIKMTANKGDLEIEVSNL